MVQNFSIPAGLMVKAIAAEKTDTTKSTRSSRDLDTKVVSYYTCCKTRLPGELPQGDRYDHPKLGFIVTIPFTSWSGGLSRSHNVLDVDRLYDSYFVGSATAR